MKLTTFFTAAIAALILCGCQNTVNTINQGRCHDSRFITDSFLSSRLELRSIKLAPNEAGFMRAQVEAVNARTGVFSEFWSSLTGENPYKIRYRFVWLNADGIAEKSLLNDWQDLTIMPGETLYLQSVAPSKECTNFQVSLHEAND